MTNTHPNPRHGTSPRIAVVNDDTVFLALMHDLLTDEGYGAQIFHEADQAYEQVRAMEPDALILDIRMESPEMGWHLLDVFKLDRVLGAKPMIVCSADVRALQERAAHLSARGVDVLVKPFDLDDLLKMLRRLVGEPGTRSA